MARNRETKIELTAYDDLFQTDESRAEAALSKIRDIPLSDIDEFPDNPFKVLMDEDMEQLVESIKRNGVMTPATVRLKDDGRYELISGHRRKKACELAGLETLKCEVKDLTRDEAIIVMVESNLQRSVILPSEKAFAYKMRLEAMDRQGKRNDLTSTPLVSKSRSNEELADKVGESREQIRRFIRLTELVPEILQMVDERQIAFRPAVEISYLAEEQQYTLLESMSYNDAKGIAVFDPKGRRNTLQYYFDVSDTHDGYYGSRPVPIWQMNGRYEKAVIERLSDRFGNTESTDLASALTETAKNAVEDNLQDYFSQLKDFTQDSFLEELDDLNVEVCYRRLVTNSVAFMLMSRCGLDTNEHFDREDFEGIINFNTPATINALGIATSDISEMALKEISLAIQNLQIAEKGTNRTFVPESKSQYNIGRIQPERSENNERNHLQQARRLSYSRPDITDRARNSAWQIRTDAQELSGAAQASDLSQPADIGQAERASVSDRADGSPEIGASDEAAFSRTGRDGGTERESPDAVGTENEQHPQSSGGKSLAKHQKIYRL